MTNHFFQINANFNPNLVRRGKIQDGDIVVVSVFVFVVVVVVVLDPRNLPSRFG